MQLDRSAFVNNRFLGSEIGPMEYLEILPLFDATGALPIKEMDGHYHLVDPEGRPLMEIYWVSGQNGMDSSYLRAQAGLEGLKKALGKGQTMEEVLGQLKGLKQKLGLENFTSKRSKDSIYLENKDQALYYKEKKEAQARAQGKDYDSYKYPIYHLTFLVSGKSGNEGMTFLEAQLEEGTVTGNNLSAMRLSDLKTGYVLVVGQARKTYLIFGDQLISRDKSLALKHIYSNQLNVNEILEEEFGIKEIYAPKKDLTLENLAQLDPKDARVFKKIF